MKTQLQNCPAAMSSHNSSIANGRFLLKALLMCAIIIATVNLSAQIKVPNSSFETGTGNTPASWKTLNNVQRIMSYKAPYNGGTLTISPADGKYFMKLRTDSAVSASTNARLGYISTMIPAVGLPDSFAFDRMYFPKIADDNYVVQLSFLKYDSSTHQVNQVYSTSSTGFTTSTAWIRESIQLDYFGAKVVYDSMMISISSANPSQHDPVTMQGRWGIGATLLFDNFRLISNSATGIKETKVSFGLPSSVYPNPSNGGLNIEFPLDKQTPVQLQIMDAQGRLLKTISQGMLPAGINKIQLEEGSLAPGMYLYRINAGTISGQGRIIVHD